MNEQIDVFRDLKFLRMSILHRSNVEELEHTFSSKFIIGILIGMRCHTGRRIILTSFDYDLVGRYVRLFFTNGDVRRVWIGNVTKAGYYPDENEDTITVTEADGKHNIYGSDEIESIEIIDP